VRETEVATRKAPWCKDLAQPVKESIQMNKTIIALAAVAAVFVASTLEASARPGGGGGGGGRGMGGMGGGGMRMGGGGMGMRMGGSGMGMRMGSVGMRSVGSVGMRSVGINRGFVGVNRGFVGVNRGVVGAGIVRSARISNFPLHRTHFRNRFFVGGGFGYGLGYSSCVRNVLTAYGWQWVNVCDYPDNYYY